MRKQTELASSSSYATTAKVASAKDISVQLLPLKAGLLASIAVLSTLLSLLIAAGSGAAYVLSGDLVINLWYVVLLLC